MTLYRPCKITGERAILRPSINASLEAAQSAWMDEKVRSRGRGAGGRKSERAGQDDDEGDAGGSETTVDSEIVAGTRACTYPPPSLSVCLRKCLCLCPCLCGCNFVRMVLRSSSK